MEAVEKFGAEQVQIWRRSFATPPPTMEEGHEYYQTIQKVRMYKIEFHSGICFQIGTESLRSCNCETELTKDVKTLTD